MNTYPEFSLDLAFRVKYAIERRGYCMFGRDEMDKVWAASGCSATSRLNILKKFAEFCGVEVESGNRFQCARFVPRSPMNAPLVSSVSAVVTE